MNLKNVFPIFLIFLFSGCFCLHRECSIRKDDLTNPILRYMSLRELKNFKNKIEPILERHLKTGDLKKAAVYFRTLPDGMWFGINEKEQFAPASLMKVPVMMSILKMSEKDPHILTTQIKAEELNIMPQNISPEKKLQPGQVYTAEDLLYRMIVYSDNPAQDLLLKRFGREAALRATLDLGILVYDDILKNELSFSIKNYAGMFRILYNASYLNKKMSQKALEYLTEVKFKEGIAAGLPRGVCGAHKFGERFFKFDFPPYEEIVQMHDCGIIYHPDSPYLLAIMTQGKDFETLKKIIQEISHQVYQEVDSQSR